MTMSLSKVGVALRTICRYLALVVAGHFVMAAGPICTVPNIPFPSGPLPSVKVTYTYHTLPLSTYPAALCNDGLAAGYMLRTPSIPSNRWLIFLKGGGNCFTQETCSMRDDSLISDVIVTPTTGEFQGLLSSSSAESPDFYAANVVFVYYCSSDLWSGHGPILPHDGFLKGTLSTWNFHGKDIASAVVKDLVATTNFSKAKDALLSGDSAGGLGAFINASNLLALFPSSTRAVVAGDAGYTQDIGSFDRQQSCSNDPKPYVCGTVPTLFESSVQTALTVWSGSGNTKCVKELGNIPDCLNSSFLLANKYVPEPAFVSEAEMDTIQLTNNFWPAKNGDAASNRYACEFAHGMNALLQTVGPFTSTYAPDILGHVEVSDQAPFVAQNKFTSRSLALMSAMRSWYHHPCNGSTHMAAVPACQ